MELKNYVIRKLTTEQAGSVTPLKRLVSLVIFFTYFSLALVVLFHIKNLPTNTEEIYRAGHYFTLLIFIFAASRISLFNLNISFSARYISFGFSLLLLVYVSVGLGMNMSDKVVDYKSLIFSSTWMFPLLIINSAWKLIFVFFERKTRPYFALIQFWRFVTSSAIVTILYIGYWSVDKYWFDGYEFNYLDKLNMFLMMSAGLLYILTVVAFIVMIRYRKYDMISVTVRRASAFTKGFLLLGPLTIWFLFTNDYSTFEWPEIIYLLGISILLFVLIYLALSKKDIGSSSKIFLLYSVTTLVLIIAGKFAVERMIDTDKMNMIAIFLPAVMIVMLINTIVEPYVPKFFATAYISFVYATGLYIIMIWLISNFSQDIALNLPMSLGEILLIPWITTLLAMQAIIVVSTYMTFRGITRNAIKLNKYQTGKKVVKEKQDRDKKQDKQVKGVTNA